MSDLLRRMLFLPPEGSAAAADIDHLHFFVILTTLFASTVIGLVAVYFMARYTRRMPDQPTPHIEAPRWLEALFVIVPLSLFLLWFRIGFGQFVAMTTPPENAMDVYVTGKKWMWKFAYPSGPSGLEVLRVPADRPVRLLITSRDVIHGFYIPAFRIKQDALPGRYTQTWFAANGPGTYPIYCSQYCGTNHSTMRAQVIVMPPAEFDRWMESQKSGNSAARDTAPAEPRRDANMVEIGRDLAVAQGCFKCHSTDGTVGSGPSFRDLYRRHEPLEGGGQVTADEGYMTESMMDPRAKIVAGFKPVMPSYFGRLDAPETAAIVEFIKTLRSGSDIGGAP